MFLLHALRVRVYLPQHNVLYIVDIMGRRALQHVCLGQKVERMYSDMWIAIKTFVLRYNHQVLKYTYEDVYIMNGGKNALKQLNGTVRR